MRQKKMVTVTGPVRSSPRTRANLVASARSKVTRISEKAKLEIQKNPGFVLLSRINYALASSYSRRRQERMKEIQQIQIRRSNRLAGSVVSVIAAVNDKTTTLLTAPSEENGLADQEQLAELQATCPLIQQVSTDNLIKTTHCQDTEEDKPDKKDVNCELAVKECGDMRMAEKSKPIVTITPMVVETEKSGLKKSETKNQKVDGAGKSESSEENSTSGGTTELVSAFSRTCMKTGGASDIVDKATWDKPIDVNALQNVNHAPYNLNHLRSMKHEPKLRVLRKPESSSSSGSNKVQEEAGFKVNDNPAQRSENATSPNISVLLEQRPKNRTTYFEVNSRETVPLNGYMKIMPGINGSTSVRDVQQIVKHGVLDRSPTNGDVENLEFFLSQICRFEYLCETHELLTFFHEEVKRMKRNRGPCLWIVVFQNLILKTQNLLHEIAGGVFKLV